MTAPLIYLATTSLDGYMADEQGSIDWSTPDEEVHAFVNDLARPVGTFLFGRRMYETMLYWENPPGIADEPPVMQDFEKIWVAASKIVYSRTLGEVSSADTQLERDFDPEVVGQMKRAAEREISVGGADLAAQAFRAGLVDECHLFLVPIVLGGGTPALPRDLRFQLELVDERRFGNGTVYLHHRVRN